VQRQRIEIIREVERLDPRRSSLQIQSNAGEEWE